MSDGTVPVKRATGATSDTLNKNTQEPCDTCSGIGCAECAQITLSFVRDVQGAVNCSFFPFMWTAWVVVDGKAFKYSSHLDRSEAYRVAKSFNGVVTETPLVADFREQANGGQKSNH